MIALRTGLAVIEENLAVAAFEMLKTGQEGRTERLIDASLMTMHVGGRGLFATPSMILLMELTAHGSVEPQLPAGYTTVGYEVCVRHLAPAQEGETVVVSSRLTGVEGNRLLFEVECRKDGITIGVGTHRRAIVPALTE
jgi:predicted thioesterase